MSYPTNYQYTKEQRMVLVEGGGGTIASRTTRSTNWADIVFVDLPKVERRSPRAKRSARWNR